MDAMNQKFREWFLGDEDAVQFAALIWDASQTWDDLYDEGDVSSANRLIQFFAFGMDHQPFFRRFAPTLRAGLLTMYLGWRDANVLEEGGDPNDLRKAYVLRAGIYTFYVLMAWLLGGEDHSAKVGPEIQRFYGETFEEYAKEFTHA